MYTGELRLLLPDEKPPSIAYSSVCCRHRGRAGGVHCCGGALGVWVTLRTDTTTIMHSVSRIHDGNKGGNNHCNNHGMLLLLCASNLVWTVHTGQKHAVR